MENRLAEWKMDGDKVKKSSLKKLDETINQFWKENIYTRTYTDRSDSVRHLKEPTEEDIKRIFHEMGKYEKKDELNCQAGGYASCREMAKAIFNGVNKMEHCSYYVMHKMTQDFKAQIQSSIDNWKRILS